ncbi:beta-alanine transporter-like isoform X2 [Macrobrachium nipponense]|uniref:beta-alanine transporter-like isoform X2 n=1 Tax=Macrobrachium nipponense TaxID=159736 RepID=UPI0030C7CDAB
MDFDEILPDLGEYGTYQKLVLWFLLLPGTMPCGFHAYNQLFMAFTPEHWCRVPDLDDKELSSEVIKNLSIPYDDVSGEYSSCQRYDYNFSQYMSSSRYLDGGGILGPPPDAKVIPCDNGWHYDLPEYSTSVVSDWDLVCDSSFYPTLALVLLGASGLVGNYIFGYIQDGCGRRPAFFIYLLIESAFGIATAFAPTFHWWLVCRVGVGFTVPAIMSTPMVLAIELVGPGKRTYTTVIMNVAYSFTLILLSGVAYLVRDWAQLSLATTIPFLAFFFFWCVLPESPRWLLANGRLEEAEKIMRKMARVNRKQLPENYMANLRRKHEIEKYMTGKEDEKVQRSYGVMDLFRTPNLCRKTLIITFIWFTNTSVYVGLSYYAPALGGDAYLNFFLAGLAELPTYLFLWPSTEYWGRRWTLCFSMVVGGSACVATVLTQNDPTVTLVLYCVGKFGISASFVVLPLMASELYPTVVRGMGLSVSAVAGMIGPIVIPLINHLGSEMMVLPLIIMGILLNLGGIFSLMLPETLHQHLPQTLEEGEEFGKHWTMSDYCACCPKQPSSMNGTARKMSTTDSVLQDRLSDGAPEESFPVSNLLKSQDQERAIEDTLGGGRTVEDVSNPGTRGSDDGRQQHHRVSFDESSLASVGSINRRRKAGSPTYTQSPSPEQDEEEHKLIPTSRKVTVV